jgi:hypothetical protein
MTLESHSKSINYLIFQGIPAIFNTKSTLKDNALTTCSVRNTTTYFPTLITIRL